MENKLIKPEFLFEVSWEVCNKIGAIHSILSTRHLTLSKEINDNIIYIGPDIWKGNSDNSEFIQDNNLFPQWKLLAQNKNLRIKTGYWNIPGKPKVILIDFTTLIPNKNDIFTNFWELYKLDSISGNWDYTEATMFGYAAGQTIEHFFINNLRNEHNVVAHFHEWTTGSGLLYLKENLPQVATVFTSHATALGRTMSSNLQSPYHLTENFNDEQKARELSIRSNHSLEKKSAQNADCFTTVSDITAKECRNLLNINPAVINLKGFDKNIVPDYNKLSEKKKASRNLLANVAKCLTGKAPDANAIFTCISGRYEMVNKGIDVFLDVLKQLHKQDIGREVVAFVLTPSDAIGPRKDLKEMLEQNVERSIDFPFTTHSLNNFDQDLIVKRIRESGFSNAPDSKVKLIYVPQELNGSDEIFNVNHHDLIPGFDLTVHPSYYDPWGTPAMESIALGVPTITTNLSGFGNWVKENLNVSSFKEGVEVIERNDHNRNEVIHKIIQCIKDYCQLPDEEIEEIRRQAINHSLSFHWENIIDRDLKSFDIALEQIPGRTEKISQTQQVSEELPVIDQSISSEPVWKRLYVESKLPESLKGLEEISNNLWWCWNYEAVELFEVMDPGKWDNIDNNPVQLIKEISLKRLNELEADQEFMQKYNKVYSDFKNYMNYTPPKDSSKIAYFSMEYGLHQSLKIYSGGLGILAGDYLKAASDFGVNMCAIGLIYRFGYFTQTLSIHGEQQANYITQNFSNLPLKPVRDNDGNFKKISLNLPGRKLHARIWEVSVGRIKLYLLDTDFELNSAEDRSITHQLYGGDWENRLKQEILLGMGGIKTLNELGIKSDVYHCNEGHAALINVERLKDLIHEYNFSFDRALEIVRASSLFTTHTPVPAGHDKFDEDLIRIYLRHYPDLLHISWDQFLGMGRENQEDKNEKFSMSALAARSSQEMNGVSMLHGEVSKEMFQHMWRGFYKEELHIHYVTNGVHYPTWTASEWQRLYESRFGEDFILNRSDKKYWRKIFEVDDKTIWDLKNRLRKDLIDYIKHKFETSLAKRNENPGSYVGMMEKFDDKALTIGFARRFATYKRAHLLFTDLDRLDEIINNPDYPVQFLFAGKAHPADTGGQGLIKRIVEISRMPRFTGKILFLENYDMKLAARLVRGVDIWLNTPTRPLEASGTSGQKVEMNGGLNFSVLDGWWVEGYKEGAGWAITEKRTYENQMFQDELDAATVYNIFENDIVPLFYKRNSEGIPVDWIQYVKKSISEIAPEFTTKRMIDDYIERFYNPMTTRYRKLAANDFAKSLSLVRWKRRIAAHWKNIELVDISFPNIGKQQLGIGEFYEVDVTLNLNELVNEQIRAEMVVVDQNDENNHDVLIYREDLKLEKIEGTKAFYKIDFKLTHPGMFKYAIRIYPWHEDLPHRQDFAIMRWI